MERDVWLAIYIGLLIQVAATLIAFGIPNTHEKKTRSCRDTPSSQLLNSVESTVVKPQSQTLSRRFRQATQKTALLLRWVVFENRSLGLILLTLLFTSLGQYAKVLELQYITKRYELSWSRVSILSWTLLCQSPWLTAS